MSDFKLKQKVYFGFPGIALIGTIEVIYYISSEDIRLAKVKCNINPLGREIIKYYYIPVSELRTKY